MNNTNIIAIYNQKGGVGKTSTTLQMADMLVKKEFKVLVIDMDPQTNLSRSLLPTYNPYVESEQTIYHLLMTDRSLKECSRKVKKNLDIVVSCEKHEQSDYEMFLSSVTKPAATRLSEKISPSKVATNDMAIKKSYDILQTEINETYDYIIIDCSPSANLLSTVSLSACDSVLIPVSNDRFAIDGISGVVRNIEKIKKQFNQGLKIDGIFLNAGKNIKSYNELHELLLDKLPSYVLNHKVYNYSAVNKDTFKKQISESHAKEQFEAVFEEVGYGIRKLR